MGKFNPTKSRKTSKKAKKGNLVAKSKPKVANPVSKKVLAHLKKRGSKKRKK